MAKLTLSPLTSLSSEASAISTINANNDAIVAAIEETLSRNGTRPNGMGADLDMDSNDILNANEINAQAFKINGVDIGGGAGSPAIGTISVSGQSDVVADIPEDTVTFVAGTNVTITTAGSAITFNSSGGGGGGLTDGDKGDIVVSGTGTVLTVDSDVITNAKLANVATSTIKGRVTGGTGDPEDLTPTQAKTVLAIASTDVSGLGTLATQSGTFSGTSSGTNTGDQTTIVGITGTKAQFDTAVTDGNFLYVGDVTSNATHTGDVTGATALTIAANAVTNAKLATMATLTIKGNNTGGASDPIDLTAAQVKTLLAIANTDVSGLGTAAVVNTGTSGATIPLLNAANTFASGQVFTDSMEVSGSTTANIFLDGAASQVKGVVYQTGNVNRWEIGANGSLESGGNAGSNFRIRSFDDSGTLIDNPIIITRSTGVVTLSAPLPIGSGGTGATTAAGATAALDVFTSALKGLAPSSGGGTTNFLRADGSWAAPGGGGGSGDVVGPASSTDNAITRFDSTTGKLVQDSGVIVNDDNSLTLPAVSSDPAAPSAGNVILMARTSAGRTRLAERGPSSTIIPLQEALAFTRVVEVVPNFGGTAYVAGANGITSVGTATAAAIATTSRYTQEAKIEHLVTVASPTAVAGFRSSQNQLFRGANANQGGFYFVCRWGPATGVATATTRCFVGLTPAYVPTDVEPSSLVNMLGMGWDAADTNVQFMHNDASGTCTKIDTGFVVPTVDRTTLIDFEMYCAPNGSEVFFKYTNIVTGDTFSSSATTNLPANTTLMTHHGWMSAGGTSSVIGLALCRLRTETD